MSQEHIEYEKIEAAFDAIILDFDESFPMSLEELEKGQLPTQNWLIDGRLDGEYPVFWQTYFFRTSKIVKLILSK